MPQDFKACGIAARSGRPVNCRPGEEGPLAKAVIPQGLPVHTVITPPELGKAYRIQYPGRKR